MLAIVLVSKELDSPKENIDAYTFKPPNKMVISETGNLLTEIHSS